MNTKNRISRNYILQRYVLIFSQYNLVFNESQGFICANSDRCRTIFRILSLFFFFFFLLVHHMLCNWFFCADSLFYSIFYREHIRLQPARHIRGKWPDFHSLRDTCTPECIFLCFLLPEADRFLRIRTHAISVGIFCAENWKDSWCWIGNSAVN